MALLPSDTIGMLEWVDGLGLNGLGVDQTLCFRVGAGQDELGIDVQGGGSAAWRIDEARKSIGESVLVIEISLPDRSEGWLITDETSEPIR